ncbi:MAG: deoxyguanosinetriphosphate triphosphohydrolase [Negativicoccus succinicivorans]|uniref:deoxyguanosinetriphosphate triphosphohydrolase n=1 Tax=Negativicoccus succinicivorans TaxID=620903 RepID=UPI0029099C3B|nr:deoxyguanosinetriphosphate triphosphohydrolase [Negativicoccus succinicivorans]MDU4559076.1 deoxyguanosinetriphosphate triphosphohydrolase [Negativicoccus succinicivorans]MDU4576231.1 deoxyguanosinetriphosphate triphosphohydrolase [Negativicoccus succinicivorans]
MQIREVTEEREVKYLATHAAHSRDAVRERPQDKDPLRTEYQRDRDRILHSKAFRRLKHKTQVYIAPTDHYRTRMTHTLEVSQIARTMARALRLNEDLTEAIALGHDVGHTPFGHVGEFAIRDLFGHFHHNEQSLRVLDVLEKHGAGLNLTQAVRDGILNHTGPNLPQTLEGQLVRYSDRIAYLCHDFDDAERAGMLTADDLPAEVQSHFGTTHSSMITAMVSDLVYSSSDRETIIMTDATQAVMGTFREFMFANVYQAPALVPDRKRGYRLVQELCRYYLEDPARLPVEHQPNEIPVETAVIDYVAGLTDEYAIRLYQDVFLPRYWDVK